MRAISAAEFKAAKKRELAHAHEALQCKVALDVASDDSADWEEQQRYSYKKYSMRCLRDGRVPMEFEQYRLGNARSQNGQAELVPFN